MNEWLKQNLVCPRDYSKLSLGDDTLTCEMAHTYPYVGGIPMMLIIITLQQRIQGVPSKQDLLALNVRERNQTWTFA